MELGMGKVVSPGSFVAVPGFEANSTFEASSLPAWVFPNIDKKPLNYNKWLADYGQIISLWYLPFFDEFKAVLYALFPPTLPLSILLSQQH